MFSVKDSRGIIHATFRQACDAIFFLKHRAKAAKGFYMDNHFIVVEDDTAETIFSISY